MSDQSGIEKPVGKRAKYVLVLVGTIVLGAVGSGLWEMVFRPGFGWLGKAITSVSDTAENAVYMSAAMDPTVVPDLFLLMILVLVPGLMAGGILIEDRLMPIFERRLDARVEKFVASLPDGADRDQEVDGFLVKSKRRFGLFLAAYLLVIFCVFFVAFSIHNRAVLVWRTFHQNLEICAPYMTERQLLEVKSGFRSAKGRSDFDKVRGSLDDLAKQNGAELVWYDNN